MTDRAGRSLRDALLRVWPRSNQSPFEATTDARGVAAVIVPRDDLPVVSVEVRAASFATHWRFVRKLESLNGTRGDVELSARLEPGARVRIRCRTVDSPPPHSFNVELAYGGRGVEPERSGDTPGVRRRLTVRTDSNGVVDVDGLHPGHWDVWASRWQSVLFSPHVMTSLRAGSNEGIELVAEGWDLEHFASGRVVPSPWEPSADGVCRTVRFETSEGRAAPVYEGGRFYLEGPKGGQIEFWVVDARTGEEGEHVVAKVGRHDHELQAAPPGEAPNAR